MSLSYETSNGKKAKYEPNSKVKERREYCAQHCQLNELAKKSVPWRTYMASMSFFLTLALVYVGVSERRNYLLEGKMEALTIGVRQSVEKRIALHEELFQKDLSRFFDIARRNGEKLDIITKDVSTLAAANERFDVLQQLVMKKIKLVE